MEKFGEKSAPRLVMVGEIAGLLKKKLKDYDDTKIVKLPVYHFGCNVISV